MFLLLLIDLLLIELLLIGFLLIRFPINQISVDWFPCCRFTAPAYPSSTASGAGMFRYYLFILFTGILESDEVVIFYIKRTRVVCAALWSYEQIGIRVSLHYPFHAVTAFRKDSILDKSFSPRLDSTPLLTSTA